MISVNKESKMPVYVQITNGVIKQILKGRIKPGLKMPGSRSLAGQLGVHRNTIITSYEELESQGWITAIPAKGNYVNKDLPIVKSNEENESIVKTPLKKSRFSLEQDRSIDFGILKTKNYDLNFDDGCPDIRIAPIKLLARHYRSILNSKSRYHFDYSWDLAGNMWLRKELVKYLAETRGINVSVDNIMITRGSLMGFYLLFKNLIKPNDTIIVGETSYLPVNKIITDFKGNLNTVSVDEQGLNVDEIESLCKKKKIRAVYVIPHHHHPTTVTLSCDRRMKLLLLAKEYNFAIIEDDYDYDFHYDSSPILPLMSSDDEGSVIYTGSFSKSLAPAFRIGYLVAPENVIQKLSYSRRYIDRQGDMLMERALAMMLEEGELKRHLRKALLIYKSRRDYFCELLESKLKDKVTFTKPKGGLTVWVKFDKSIDLNALVINAEKKGLFMVNPNVYNPKGKSMHSSRLGFASMNKDELNKSVAILSSLINRK